MQRTMEWSSVSSTEWSLMHVQLVLADNTVEENAPDHLNPRLGLGARSSRYKAAYQIWNL